MKKAVAVVLVIVAVLMGGMLVWGFLDKQNKEGVVQEPKNTTQTQSTDTAQSDNLIADKKTISSAELAKHNKSTDCWVAIRDNVYDVTSYLDEHPGGADLILTYCGKDATTAFNTKGGEGRHSSKAEALLNNYLVGTFN